MAIDLNSISMKNSLADISVPDKVKRHRGDENAEERIKRQKNEYFTLLTTQLKNQDPMSPMDTAEMTSQIFGINEVEQHLETNRLLDDIKKIFLAEHNAAHLNYIDKFVEYQGDEVAIETDSATFTYNILEKAAGGTIKIKDMSNNIVHSQGVDSKMGLQSFTWNKPPQLPSGTYKFSIEAERGDGEPAKVMTFASGRVKSIITKEGKHFFEINDKMVSIDDSVRIRSASSTADSLLASIKTSVDNIQSRINQPSEPSRGNDFSSPMTQPIANINDPAMIEAIKQKLNEMKTIG